MKSKIAILGCRNLACEITKWILSTQSVEIVGALPPPFTGWWDDQFRILLKSNNINICKDIDEIIALKPDIIFSINYWKTIDLQHINKVPKGIINIHHSYLLKFKGRYSTSWAIIHARKDNCWEHGTTLHYINENLDEGEIIDSWKCEIKENDTAEILFARVEKLAYEMFKANFTEMLVGVKIYKTPSEISYFYSKESNINLEIDHSLPIAEIYDMVRAWSFKDRPKPYLIFNDEKIYLSLELNK